MKNPKLTSSGEMPLKETIYYDEMCPKCKAWYEEQYKGPVVLTYLIVCRHAENLLNQLPKPVSSEES